MNFNTSELDTVNDGLLLTTIVLLTGLDNLDMKSNPYFDCKPLPV